MNSKVHALFICRYQLSWAQEIRHLKLLMARIIGANHSLPVKSKFHESEALCISSSHTSQPPPHLFIIVEVTTLNHLHGWGPYLSSLMNSFQNSIYLSLFMHVVTTLELFYEAVMGSILVKGFYLTQTDFISSLNLFPNKPSPFIPWTGEPWSNWCLEPVNLLFPPLVDSRTRILNQSIRNQMV